MSNALPKLQPVIKSGISERTLKVEVLLPLRAERFRNVTSIGTKEVLDYLVATKTPHGKLLTSPGAIITNRSGEAVGVWTFESKDLRIKEVKSSKKTPVVKTNPKTEAKS